MILLLIVLLVYDCPDCTSLEVYAHLSLHKPTYSNTGVKRPLSKDQTWVFKTNYRLTQVKSIADYFRPSLSYHLSIRSLFESHDGGSGLRLYGGSDVKL